MTQTDHRLTTAVQYTDHSLLTGKCPVDKAELDIMVANLAVAEQIGELYVYCQYGTQPSRDGFPFEVNPTGCPLTVRLSAKR